MSSFPSTPKESVSTLLTDLYQLTMLNAYYERGMEGTAVFEFSVRRLPARRNFLLAVGIEQVLDYLESLCFTAQEIAWLGATGKFKPEFLERLATFRFTGDVYAMPEGTVCFADEPILRVTAPLPEAQLVESRLINLLNFQMLIASKAARYRIAAGTRQLVDFGMRRAHGAEAALLAARASYIAGFDATSNVEAAYRFGLPLSGTMAHSFIQAHDDEVDAFRVFARAHRGDLILLIDTYDIVRAAQSVVELSRELAREDIRISGVRIDSGDVARESMRVRDILDRGGCSHVRIFVSGGLDEQTVAELVRTGVAIDGFGVGTAMTTSADAPSLDCTYKLQQYAGKPRFKRSQSKATWPGTRQVHRMYDEHGKIAMDLVSRVDEIVEGKELLALVMTNGRRLAPPPALQELRQRCAKELESLPPAYLTLEHGPRSPVKMSRGLHELAHELNAH